MSSFKIGDRVVIDTNAAINIREPIHHGGHPSQITKDKVCTVLYVGDTIITATYQSYIKNDGTIIFTFFKKRFKLYKPIVNTPKEAV